MATASKKTSKPDESIRTDRGLQLLVPGERTNIVQWREALLTKARIEFGVNGNVIADVGDHDFPDIRFEEDDLTAEADPHGFNKAAITAQIRERERKIANYNVTKINVYGLIWAHLSPESEDRGKRHDDFNGFDTDRDPAGLMRAIIEIHALNAGTHAVLNFGASEEAYRNLRQYKGESITDFKERFDSCVANLEAVNAETPSEQSQALKFMHALRKSIRADFCNSVVNDAHRGRAEVPVTVSAMYKAAIEHIPMYTGPSSFASTSAVFVSAPSLRSRNRSPPAANSKAAALPATSKGTRSRTAH